LSRSLAGEIGDVDADQAFAVGEFGLLAGFGGRRAGLGERRRTAGRAAAVSLLSLRFTVRGLLIAAMLASAVMIVVLGQGQADIAGLSCAAAAGGFCTNAGMVGLHALAAAALSTAVRGGGDRLRHRRGTRQRCAQSDPRGLLSRRTSACRWSRRSRPAVRCWGALAIFILPHRNAEGQ